MYDYDGVTRPQSGYDIGAFEYYVAGPDTNPPSQVSGLTATGISSTQINLAWSPATDDRGIAGYMIYRCSGSGCTPTANIANTTSLFYQNTGLSTGMTYTYKVAAYDAANNIGPISASASATASDTTPPSISNATPSGTLASGTTQAIISLSTNEPATCRYSTTSGTAYSAMTNTFTTTGEASHSTVVSGLANGTTYNYYVRCIDTFNNPNTNDFTITFSIGTPLGVIAQYGFNEGTGTTASDSSGNNYHSNLVNGPAWTTGRYGNGLSFDGTNDRVTGPSINLPGTFTLTAWVNAPSHQQFESVISVGANREFFLNYGAIRFYYSSNTAAMSSAAATNTWNHVAITYDGTSMRGY
jgi:hypothetical protein